MVKLLGGPLTYSETILFTTGSIIGDLYASYIKRSLGVKGKHIYPYGGEKDFSQILGAHGGIMDRFDSMFIVLPMLTIYKNLHEVYLKSYILQ
uniref:Cytidylyltransferase family protein n=1 Tax=Megaviridae environmental sample TaxID=1737588 RepID=A0A5J6VJ83_9VIRU|nr:MAG: cytidylyltransferase family protein [Megaviridae environmental sample]